VDLRSDAQPPPSVAAVEADAVKTFALRELAHGDFEDLRGLVELQDAAIIGSVRL
jgi:hypothetical protein